MNDAAKTRRILSVRANAHSRPTSFILRHLGRVRPAGVPPSLSSRRIRLPKIASVDAPERAYLVDQDAVQH